MRNKLKNYLYVWLVCQDFQDTKTFFPEENYKECYEYWYRFLTSPIFGNTRNCDIDLACSSDASSSCSTLLPSWSDVLLHFSQHLLIYLHILLDFFTRSTSEVSPHLFLSFTIGIDCSYSITRSIKVSQILQNLMDSTWPNNFLFLTPRTVI